MEVQFQLNRVPLCEMHYAVDKLPDLSLVHPDVRGQAKKLKIPWTPGRQWQAESELAANSAVAKLNPKQREAIVAITTEITDDPLPPILIIGEQTEDYFCLNTCVVQNLSAPLFSGPYGTGKTFTLGQTIKLLLKQEGSRVLVCTHSNSAADLYIREYLHPYILENPSVKLRRVYYRNRWVQTVNQTVQKYCLITEAENARVFRNPKKEDVDDCNVVVATLSTSRLVIV